ncbi:MAG: TetR/AcrR family transcriptional regulator [Oscillospiraceae bacterium]|nr:TetR/AcrR family transcriptional regulator [Oscillospiraceae bacterium]
MKKAAPKLSLRERKKLQVETEITKNALRLFQKKGYAAVSIEEIAECANISKGTFYNYFPNKDDVLIKIAHNSMRIVSDRLDVMPDHSDPVNLLRQTFYFLLDDIYSWQTVAREIALAGVTNENARNVVYQLIVDNVRRAQEIGVFRKDYSYDVIARSLMGIYYIAIFGLDPSLSLAECKAQLNTAFSIILEGVLCDKAVSTEKQQ